MASFTVLAIIVSVCFILVINDTYAGNKLCVPCLHPNFGDDNVAQQEVVAEPDVEMEELNPLDEHNDTHDIRNYDNAPQGDDLRNLFRTDSTVNIEREAAQNQEDAQSSRIETPKYTSIETPRHKRRSKRYTSKQQDDDSKSISVDESPSRIRSNLEGYPVEGSGGSWRYTSTQQDDDSKLISGDESPSRIRSNLEGDPVEGGHFETRHDQELLSEYHNTFDQRFFDNIDKKFTGQSMPGSSTASNEKKNRKKRSGSKQQDDN